MTWRKRQTIEHMWKVASGNPHHDTNWHDPVVIAFAALVREEAQAEEREACAKVCDAMEEKAEGTECCKWPTPIDCAHAIRARGQE